MDLRKIRIEYIDGPTYIITYHSDTQLHWENLADGVSSVGKGDEQYNLYTLDDKHILLSWKEETGITVTQHYDFEKQIIHSFISIPDGDFLHFQGHYKIIDEEKA